MNALHKLLLGGAAAPDEPAILAIAGVISLRELRLPAYRAPIIGLSEQEFRRLLRRFFPALDLAQAAAWLPLEPYPLYTPGVGDEFPDLLNLLLEHVSFSGEEARWLAHTVATGCMGRNHLWQDLGLLDRGMLSALLSVHFATLFRRNVGDMKWKKFFYKQLCDKAAINLCRAPSCGVCTDYQRCFGQEPGRPLLAAANQFWQEREAEAGEIFERTGKLYKTTRPILAAVTGGRQDMPD
ncbi:MAG: nitrogen fixation protein NifQ [Candidatus Competibacteraceae bacterium]